MAFPLVGGLRCGAEFFAHPEDPRFGVVQIIISTAVFVAVVGGFGFFQDGILDDAASRRVTQHRVARWPGS
jgi:hypothetical protein